MIAELYLVASVYHASLNGHIMAGGAYYKHQKLSCAHKDWPFGTLVTVSRLGRIVILPVTDRGPFVEGRALDVSGAAAKWLRMDGVHKLKVLRVVKPECIIGARGVNPCAATQK